MGWLDQIQELKVSFNCITFAHIYREGNGEADTLSKKALQILEGKIQYNKWIDGREGPTHFLLLFLWLVLNPYFGSFCYFVGLGGPSLHLLYVSRRSN
jgi:hypothetical protein